MKNLSVTIGCTVTLILSFVSPGFAQNNKVNPQLILKAQRDGLVRVSVALDVAAAPEVHLDRQTVPAQRNSITAAQNRLAAELRGAKFKVIGRFKTLPGIALEVDRIGLAMLENSLTVTEVSGYGAPTPLRLATSVPRVGAAGGSSGGFSGIGWSVAVLDTGVHKSHPSLNSPTKIIAEACFSTQNDCTDPQTGDPVSQVAGTDTGLACAWTGNSKIVGDCLHGTIMSAIAAGSGSTPGVASGATIISINIFSRFTGQVCTNQGLPDPCLLSDPVDQELALDHILFLNNLGHKIAAVNMSLGSGDNPAY